MKVVFFEGTCGLTQLQINVGTRTINEEVQDFLNENPNIIIREIKQSSASIGDSNDLGSLTTVSIWYNEQ